jgi:hypothetical protein
LIRVLRTPKREPRGSTLMSVDTETGSKSDQALNLLASWSATLDHAETAHATDGA